MENGINRFLRSLRRFFLFQKEPAKTTLFQKAPRSMTEEQSIQFLNYISTIIKEETAKRGMHVRIQNISNVVINPPKEVKTQGDILITERPQMYPKNNSNDKGKT